MTWQIDVDTGGTFTDAVAVDPQGHRRRLKVLSTSAVRGTVDAIDGRRVRVQVDDDIPLRSLLGLRLRSFGGDVAPLVTGAVDDWIELETPPPPAVTPGGACEFVSDEPAPCLAARLLMGVAGDEAWPPCELRLATTRATNALLERRGAPVAFFVTEGFGDLLTIGDQTRPDLFALDIRRPDPLPLTTVEVRERLDADGGELVPVDLTALKAAAATARRLGAVSAAVALLHADRNDAHEQQVAEVLRGAGFDPVVVSSAVAARVGLLARSETTTLEAYLGPVVAEYVARVRARCDRLRLLTSAGGLVGPDAFRACDSLLSGPAGGVTGAAAAGRAAGFTSLLTLDMGGTSADVARYAGDFEYVFEHRVGGVRTLVPALDIETVAAGGGSICRFEDGRLAVGPESAGADPGPACYGGGGPLTMTDVNVLVGHVVPGCFPIPVDPDAAAAALDRLHEEVIQSRGRSVDRDDVLDGLRAINDERIADAIREVSVRRGYDPAAHALVAFGGAGGQHACAVAGRLGMDTVIVPFAASVLSAVGLGAAVPERFAERQVLAPLDEVRDDLSAWLEALAANATAELAADGVVASSIRRRLAFVRAEGQASSLEVTIEDDGASIESAFADRHAEVYGHLPPPRPIEVVMLRVIVSGAARVSAAEVTTETAPASAVPKKIRMRVDGVWNDAPAWAWSHLPAACAGPALIVGDATSVVVPAGWTASMTGDQAITLRREAATAVATPIAARAELFAHRLATIARAMGDRLVRVAISTNVRERRDFSCAVLSEQGELVVNAPHIPVHLGALGPCVRRLLDRTFEPGDAIVTNHPGWGGSHLPDVTVVTPVMTAGRPRPIAFVASRAHHAEIGGRSPGSMSPLSRTLEEEGVVILPRLLVGAGRDRSDDVATLLRNAAWPTRALADNLADLRGQLAANEYGRRAIQSLVVQHGVDVVLTEIGQLADHAETMAAAAFDRFGVNRRTAAATLDDGTPLAVAITPETGGRLRVDWTGSGDVHPGNLNATTAIVQSVVMYVLRVVTGTGLPLNEGLMRRVALTVPPGILDPPFDRDPAPAVAGGNVETSQRMAELMLLALEACAGGQGTMNNVIFGSPEFGYYETVGGGSGAGPTFDGASGVHTHMTNTRITDPETLERRYPVRLERFAIRSGSGGRGRHRGGDGLVRVYRFLAPLTLGVLSQHRSTGPPGLAGGEPGSPGRQTLERADGTRVTLAACDERRVGTGDRLLLETPGGGGYGSSRL